MKAPQNGGALHRLSWACYPSNSGKRYATTWKAVEEPFLKNDRRWRVESRTGCRETDDYLCCRRRATSRSTRKILPVKPLLERLLAGRNNRLRIGTKFAAIEAVGGTFPRVVPVDWLVAKRAAHWEMLRYRLFNADGSLQVPPNVPFKRSGRQSNQEVRD
jgi:hypothetical protein